MFSGDEWSKIIVVVLKTSLVKITILQNRTLIDVTDPGLTDVWNLLLLVVLIYHSTFGVIIGNVIVRSEF